MNLNIVTHLYIYYNLFIFIISWNFGLVKNSRIKRDIFVPYNVLHNFEHKKLQCVHLSNTTAHHNIYPAHSSSIYANYFTKNIGVHKISGYYVIVPNPNQTITVLEPGGRPGGCEAHKRRTVKESAEYLNCEAAINAGFYNAFSGQCFGNIVVDGKIVKKTDGIKNAHFGILNNGSLFFGYVSETDLLYDQFKTLVGGVIWLLRNGKSFVDESVKTEYVDTQDTGPLTHFANVISARTAVGSDRQGRVVFVHVNGKTNLAGVTLYQFADLLAELGVVNAINLDGGGSSTLVINGTVVNYPSDVCSDGETWWRCSRIVSTIICAKGRDSHSHHPDSNNKDSFTSSYSSSSLWFKIIVTLSCLFILVLQFLVRRYKGCKSTSSQNNSRPVRYLQVSGSESSSTFDILMTTTSVPNKYPVQAVVSVHEITEYKY